MWNQTNGQKLGARGASDEETKSEGDEVGRNSTRTCPGSPSCDTDLAALSRETKKQNIIAEKGKHRARRGAEPEAPQSPPFAKDVGATRKNGRARNFAQAERTPKSNDQKAKLIHRRLALATNGSGVRERGLTTDGMDR